MSNIVSGSRIIFRINGEKVAYATTVSYNDNFETEPIDVLDEIKTLEHVYTAYRVDFSAEMFRVVDKSVKQLGIFPKLDNVFTAGDLQAEFIDRPTGKTLGLITGVKATSRSGSFANRAVSRETINFVGTMMKDESEV